MRALNSAIETGCRAAGLTMQQQAFLLSLAARGGHRVPLADVRTDIQMDQATMSALLARLRRRGLVRVAAGRDRRAIDVTLTPTGRARYQRSLTGIRHEIRAADALGELDGLRRNLRAYLDFYTAD
jgi:DNA-binding MarR family transcriptional regulator